MSTLTFRGIRYERIQKPELAESETIPVASRPFLRRGTAVKLSPRSDAPLPSDTPAERARVYRLVRYQAGASRPVPRRSICEGGIIRSRLTAELLGIDPAARQSEPVRPGGIVRSRRTAELLGLNPLLLLKRHQYRGVAYEKAANRFH